MIHFHSEFSGKLLNSPAKHHRVPNLPLNFVMNTLKFNCCLTLLIFLQTYLDHSPVAWLDSQKQFWQFQESWMWEEISWYSAMSINQTSVIDSTKQNAKSWHFVNHWSHCSSWRILSPVCVINGKRKTTPQSNSSILQQMEKEIHL